MTGKKHQAVVDNMRRGGVGPGVGGTSGTREYCSTCGRWIEGSFESHKGSREHVDKARRRTNAKNSGGTTGSSSTPSSNTGAAAEEKDKDKPASEEEPKSESVRHFRVANNFVAVGFYLMIVNCTERSLFTTN